MKTKRYARDLKVGDLLYHWDNEGLPETITRIYQAVTYTQDGIAMKDEGYLVFKCKTYTMHVHRNDIRNIESNTLDQRN